jgi:hypothetical protein
MLIVSQNLGSIIKLEFHTNGVFGLALPQMDHHHLCCLNKIYKSACKECISRLILVVWV